MVFSQETTKSINKRPKIKKKLTTKNRGRCVEASARAVALYKTKAQRTG
jgi:hypothetical protein